MNKPHIPTKKQVEDILTMFSNFHKRKENIELENMMEGVLDALVQRSGIKLKNIQEDSRLLYAMNDKAITNMLLKMRKGTEETIEWNKKANFPMEGLRWETLVPDEYWKLDYEIRDRKAMRKLMRRRKKLFEAGKVDEKIEVELNKRMRRIYEDLERNIPSGRITLRAVRTDPALVKKMTNRSIIDMTFRMRKDGKNKHDLRKFYGVAGDDREWEDTMEKAYWVLVEELQQRNKGRAMIGRMKKLRGLEGREDGRQLELAHEAHKT